MSDGRKRPRQSWQSWKSDAGGRRDDEGGEECEGGGGSKKGTGAGGSAYKSDEGDPWWKGMKWKIETDLGCEERTDMRCRPNGDERQGLALADDGS